MKDCTFVKFFRDTVLDGSYTSLDRSHSEDALTGRCGRQWLGYNRVVGRDDRRFF